LVSWPVFTSIERSVVDVGFRKFISRVKVPTFKRKIWKFLFQNRISKLISNVKGALDTSICQVYVDLIAAEE